MDALTCLKLQQDWGADEALEEAPIDRTRPKPAAKPALFTAKALRPTPESATSGAASIDELRQQLQRFTACSLAATATNLVFSDGNPNAGLVLVGEVPGEDDDREGKPFAGPAGAFLDRMFASIGLTRADFLLTTAIPWRPPGNRPVSDAELAQCLPFLLRHLTLLQPKLIVTFGTMPLRALTGREDNVRRLRGRWQSWLGAPAPVPILPMYHPTYVMQTKAAKKEAWADLIALRRKLNGN